MRMTRTLISAIALALVVGACATTRMPVADVPAGNYVLVEPTGGPYVALAINEWAHSVRVDDEVMTGSHWVGSDGNLHVVDDEGPCAGMESVWSYSYSGNRLTIDQVSDECTSRDPDMPTHQVFERR
jgi:hypothetical protein